MNTELKIAMIAMLRGRFVVRYLESSKKTDTGSHSLVREFAHNDNFIEQNKEEIYIAYTQSEDTVRLTLFLGDTRIQSCTINKTELLDSIIIPMTNYNNGYYAESNAIHRGVTDFAVNKITEFNCNAVEQDADRFHNCKRENDILANFLEELQCSIAIRSDSELELAITRNNVFINSIVVESSALLEYILTQSCKIIN